VDAPKDGRTGGLMDESINRLIGEWVDGRTNGLADGGVECWMAGWLAGWMD